MRKSFIFLLVILGGCATQVRDKSAQLGLSPAWQAELPHGGSTGSLLDWWHGFNDPQLDKLLQAAENDSPTLARARATIAAARANRAAAGAGLLPSLSAGLTSTKSGVLESATRPTVNTGLLDASWEIDLFGTIRHGREAATATLEAREADWHDARVTLAAEVAGEYVRFQGCRLMVDNQQETVASLRQTHATTASAVRAGLLAPSEEHLASAAAASATAALTAQQAECELSVKTLVQLTGLDEPTVKKTLGSGALPEPGLLTVRSLPVQLLSQRPDLVAAEKSLAAAAAVIGAAEAGRYPRLSLLGSIRADLGNLTPWSFGPSLTLPLFTGGAVTARIDKARADHQAALAAYRGAVRNAVREVEQGLVRLGSATRRGEALGKTAAEYQHHYQSSRLNWQAGRISLLALETARRSALQAEQAVIAVRRDRALAGIALYKALGGGWKEQGEP